MNRSFTLVRRYDAPRELVFRAWTDPEHLAWFSGAEPTAEHPATVDLRPGGAWRVHVVERRPDGRQYWSGGIYREVVVPERLVFSWGAVGGWPDIDPDDLDDVPLVTVTLAEVEGGTEMTATFGFPEAMPDERVGQWLAWGVEAGWTDTIGHLPEALGALIG